MSRNARRGLDYYEQGFGGDGLVAQTIRDARQMADGTVSETKVRKIAPWIARHLVDLDAPSNSNPDDPDYPGAGLVAMLLWGAGPDKAGAIRTQEWAQRTSDALTEGKSAKAGPSIVVSDMDDTICHGDKPIDAVVEYLRRQDADGHPVFIVSGRPVSRMDETLAWLEEHDVPHAEVHLSDFPEGPNASRAFKVYKAKQLLKTHEILEWIDNDAATRDALDALGVNAVGPRTVSA